MGERPKHDTRSHMVTEPAWRPVYGGTEKSLRQLLDESKAEWERVKPIAEACWAIEKQASRWARFQDWLMRRDLREEVMQCLRDNGLHSSQI